VNLILNRIVLLSSPTETVSRDGHWVGIYQREPEFDMDAVHKEGVLDIHHRQDLFPRTAFIVQNKVK
jgi:hypothetical protein